MRWCENNQEHVTSCLSTEGKHNETRHAHGLNSPHLTRADQDWIVRFKRRTIDHFFLSTRIDLWKFVTVAGPKTHLNGRFSVFTLGLTALMFGSPERTSFSSFGQQILCWNCCMVVQIGIWEVKNARPTWYPRTVVLP